MRVLSCFAVAAAIVTAAPAVSAKVIESADNGFTVAHTARVAASPDDVWKMLRTPDKWWSKAHSWSGNAANFWMDTQAGGCFCEKLPRDDGTFGSVQHARIVYADAGKMLRLSGALGPLQAEALTGTLTIVIQPNEKGSTILFEYVVGGYARFPLKSVSPAVDGVIGEQLAGLAKALGGALPVADGADKGGSAATPTKPPVAAAKPVEPIKAAPTPARANPATQSPASATVPAPKTAPSPAVAKPLVTSTTTAPKPATTPATTTASKPTDTVKPKP
ncbi:MAG: hypothetical protein RLZZ58_686 [Pseudomonadota bacterium]